MRMFAPAPALHHVLLLGLAVALAVLTVPTHSQITTPCSATMISSFMPCFNFITNSSSNGTTPTADCCNSVKSLTNTGMGCLCLIVTGNVPFQLPINRTLAISLPRACNMPSIPVQCKASGAPIPAPGPTILGPSLSPGVSPPVSPQAAQSPTVVPGAVAPAADSTPPDVTSQPPPAASGSPPSSTPGSRPVLTPSSANGRSYYAASSSASLLNLMFVLGFGVLKLY